MKTTVLLKKIWYIMEYLVQSFNEREWIFNIKHYKKYGNNG